MAEQSYVYMEGAVRRRIIFDPDYPQRLTVQAQAAFERLGELNRHQGENTAWRASGPQVIARVPFTEWERAYHEGWDDDPAAWNRFLNDPAHRDFKVYPGRL